MSGPGTKKTLQLQHIQQLISQLHQAVLAGKWLQVQGLDREITTAVQQLRQSAPENTFTAELQVLKQSYQQIIQLAKQQQWELEQKMKAFNDNKPGVLAYQQTTESQG